MARTLFTNVTVLDGSGTEPMPARVLIEGNRTAAVRGPGKASRRTAPSASMAAARR